MSIFNSGFILFFKSVCYELILILFLLAVMHSYLNTLNKWLCNTKDMYWEFIWLAEAVSTVLGWHFQKLQFAFLIEILQDKPRSSTPFQAFLPP